MRRGFSPSKSRRTEQYYPDRILTERPPIGRGEDYRYFCHYNNAIYMGGMLGSYKNGKGLLLHDDGSTVVSEYLSDTPSGHNIIFRDNSITSILFRSSLDYEIAYKVDKFIIKIPFSDSTHRANGQGFLIDYQQSKVFQLVFSDGVIVEKVLQMDRRDNEEIFRKNTITRTIGVKHEQAFQLTFERPENMHVKYDRNQLTIGYYNEHGELHGLGAKMYAENVETNGQKSLYLKAIERGYYRNSEIDTFGQKYFSNGNRYIGQFDKGNFEGNGILLCPQQMKWVYGQFVKGKLSEVIDSNNQRHTENEYQMWSDSLWRIHQRYRQRWIDINIELPDQLYLYRVLQEALKMQVTHINPDRQEGKERMNKIQQQFIERLPGNVQRSYVDEELDRHYSQYQYAPKSQIYNPAKYPRRRIEESTQRYTPKYRMEDPFVNQYRTSYAKRPIDNYYPDVDYKSNYASRRRPRIIDDIASKYKDYDPVDSIYRRNYLQSLERQRDNLRKLESEDQDYIRHLRDELPKSPVHRNYYSTPPKYQLDRYQDRPSKRYFSYKDPQAAYVHRWPQHLNSRDAPPPPNNNYDYYEPRVQSPPRPSRNVPYRSPTKGSRQSQPSNGFVENNYKYWR